MLGIMATRCNSRLVALWCVLLQFCLAFSQNATQLLLEFRARQAIARSKILAEGAPDRLEKLGVFAEANVTFDDSIVQNVLDGIYYEESIDLYNAGYDDHVGLNPDMRIIDLVRLMQYTDKYDGIIIPQISKLHFWYGKGDDYRCYWSENHMIMWGSSAFLLQEKFGPDVVPVDKDLRKRLLWFLQTKVKTGYYEFNSLVYFSFTMDSLLNVYDFALDAEIKAAAKDAALTLLKEGVRFTNSQGYFYPICGRCYADTYINGGSGYIHGAIGLLTGEGDFNASYTAYMAQTTLDVTEATLSYSDTLEGSYKIGHSYDEGLELMKVLSKEDRITAQMSMGGYVAPEYFTDTMHNVEHYDLWNSTYFAEYAWIRSMPEGLHPLFSWIASTRGASSVLYCEKAVYYKYKTTLMTSMENYFPGYGGAQQMPFVVTTGSFATWLGSGTPYRDTQILHSHLPYVKQKKNVALVVFYPNWDLGFTGIPDQEVYLYWENAKFTETQTADSWIFGREGNSYVGFYRHCISELEGNVLFKCKDEKQVWVSVVGHNETHGSFQEFINKIKNSKVDRESVNQVGHCITTNILVDGQSLEIEFCRNMGAIFSFIMIMVFFSLFCLAGCFVCCRKKRRVWKSCVNSTRKKAQKVKSKFSKSSELGGTDLEVSKNNVSL